MSRVRPSAPLSAFRSPPSAGRRLIRWRSVVAVMATLAALALVSTAARACFMTSPQPVQVWLDHIQVDITDQVAVKTYNCTFKNPNGGAIVGGTCYMELEPGAQVDDMSVLVDGKETKAEILDVEKANEVFQDLVKNGGSPALLEYFGNQLIRTQVPRVPAGQTVTVKLKYTTTLKKRGDLIRLQMLNTNPKALMQPLKSASVSVNIKSSEPIKNIYSPTHKIALVEKEDWDIAVEWSQEEYLPKHPFVLYYQTSPDPVGASVVAHRELDEQGAFMLMLSPTLGQGTGQVTESDILPKDVVFCVDTSGSMLAGGKMEQARAALKYCVESLRPGDRFNIVDFSTVARHFRKDGLVQLSDETRKEALKYVEKLHARGGTAIQEALELSLKHLESDSSRLKMVVFATDGLPTIGERNPEAILKAMAEKNRQDVRIFVFGEGFDVNTKLLDFLALDHRGEADYILPDENITEKIAKFFDRVGSPVMTDLEVEFEGLEVEDVYPPKIADVFRGEQVILYGRYTGHGRKTIRVTGHVGGETKTFTYEVEFPEYSEDDRNSFVPRLWAGKKVDYLLSELRKQDPPEQELVDEVTTLAKRYGIITPYTAYLMTDDVVAEGTPAANGAPGAPLAGFFRGDAAGRQSQRAQVLNKLGAAKAAETRPSAAGEKQELVRDAKGLNDLRRNVSGQGAAGAYAEEAERQLRASGKDGSSLAAIRYIGTRTFYKQGSQWIDGRYDTAEKKTLQQIEVGSDEYFKLLAADPRLAKYLALGDVLLEVKGQWYQVQTQRKKS